MPVYRSIAELVGNTPMAELVNLKEKLKLKARLFAKLEYLNPAGSVKDRVAKEMIEAKELSGELKEGSVIIEPTSGNTGIGLAAIAASRGYRAIIVMPDTMSLERQKLMRAYGAELVLTDGTGGMTASIERAYQLANEIPNAVVMGQFSNPSNKEAHKKTTAYEIWRDTDGEVDVFVSGVGTGGTISGVGEYLKEKNPGIKVVAVEPASSAILSGKPAGAHGIQGIGAGFIPQLLNTEIYDNVICVGDDDAYEYARRLAKTEGYLVGISSGAALYAACEMASRDEYAGKNIVVILPDSGDRYLSTTLFD